MIKIENLSSRTYDLKTVAGWLFSAYGRNNPKYWYSWVMHSNKNDEIPQTWGIYVDDDLAGTYSLWRCDLQSRQDLSPWFGGLYVCEKYRGRTLFDKKLGERMVLHGIKTLKQLGYTEAYLYTDKSPKYYMQFGWSPIDFSYDDKDIRVTICRISL